MWEFRNRNVFGATAFSTYGAFWMAFGLFVILALTTFGILGSITSRNDLLERRPRDFLFAFAVFNTYMLLGSMRVNTAVFGVFLALEVTLILLAIGNFNAGAHGRSQDVVAARGRLGRHRHRRDRVVHVGGWCPERAVGEENPAGRQAVLQLIGHAVGEPWK